jgi:hypothetical protein
MAFLVLGAIYADLVSNHCDLPRTLRSHASLAAVTNHSAADDPCNSGCVPDCFSCSRSEEAAFAMFASGPQVIVATFAEPETHARDGVRPLPYHPPLDLL